LELCETPAHPHSIQRISQALHNLTRCSGSLRRSNFKRNEHSPSTHSVVNTPVVCPGREGPSGYSDLLYGTVCAGPLVRNRSEPAIVFNAAHHPNW
jgi:hypothetical protein